MISKRTKRGIKLITAAVICVFTLVTTLTSTLAWFSFNKKSEVNGMSIRVAMNMTDVNGVTVHRCKLSESTSTLLKFESEPSVEVSGTGSSVTEISGIQMGEYSLLNQTQPVLLLFTFKNGIEANSINVTAAADSNGFVSAATAQNVGAFPFSSAVKFRCATYTSGTFDFDNVSVSSLGSETSFVTPILSNGNITGFTFNQQINLFTGTGNTQVANLAVVLDYYPDAIDYIVDNTAVDVFLGHNNCITFSCDWSLAL